MSHLAHSVCGVDFFLSFNKCNPLITEIVNNFKNFCGSYYLTVFSNDDICLNEDYLNTLRVQSFRSKIFLYFIDKFALECNWFLYNYIYAKTHNQSDGLPLMLPVIFDSEVDKNEPLVEFLTKDCKEVIRMSEMNSFDDFVDNVKYLLRDIIESSTYMRPVKRYVDNKRPLSDDEVIFIETLEFEENKLMKNFKLNRLNTNSILPKDKLFLAVGVPYDELQGHIIGMLHANCHVVWLDVAKFNSVCYFNFIWRKNDEDTAADTPKVYNKTAIPPNYIVFYDLNTSQFTNIFQQYSIVQKWNLELLDSYTRPVATRPSTARQASAVSQKRGKSARVVRPYEEIFYICQFKRTTDPHQTQTHHQQSQTEKQSVKSNELATYLNKEQHSIVDCRFEEYYEEVIKYNYRQLYGPINIRPLLVNLDNDKNVHLYYSALYRPIDKQVEFYIEKNLSDIEFVKLNEDYTKLNKKLNYMKAYKDECNRLKFIAIFTNRPFYEGATQLCVGLTRLELSAKINEMKLRSLFPAMLTNYGSITNDGDFIFAVFFCQI